MPKFTPFKQRDLFSYSKRNFPDIMLNEYGVCAGLCLERARIHKKTKDSTHGPINLEEINFVRILGGTPPIKEEDETHLTDTRIITNLLTRIQLYQSINHDHPSLKSQNNIYSLLDEHTFQSNSYIEISIHFKNAAHAMLVTKNLDGTYNLFDPNIGEYSEIQRVDELQQIFEQVIKKRYPDTHYYQLSDSNKILNKLNIIAQKYIYKFVQELIEKDPQNVNLDSIQHLDKKIIENIGSLLSPELSIRVLEHQTFGKNTLIITSILKKAIFTQDEKIQFLALKKLNSENQGLVQALFIASQNNDTELSNVLISNMTPDQLSITNSDGYNPLYYAITNHNNEISKFIIERMTPDQLTIQDNDGYNALYYALTSDNPEIAYSIIQKMPTNQISIQDHLGRTSLHYAVIDDHTKIATLSMAKMNSEQIAIQDTSGQTALHYAIQVGNLETAQALINKMTPDQLEIQDNLGQTALHDAIEYKHENIEKLIEEKLSKKQHIRNPVTKYHSKIATPQKRKSWEEQIKEETNDSKQQPNQRK